MVPPCQRHRLSECATCLPLGTGLSRTGLALVICIFALMPLALPTFGHDTEGILNGQNFAIDKDEEECAGCEMHELDYYWDCFTKNGFEDADGNTLSNFYPLDQDYHFHMHDLSKLPNGKITGQYISTKAGEPLNYYDAGPFSVSRKCSPLQDSSPQNPPPQNSPPQNPPPQNPPSQDPPPETGTTPSGSPPSSLPGNVTVSFTRTRYEASEGDEAVQFGVRLSKAASQDAVVEYATSSGTARAGEDYEVTTGSLTIPAGATRRTIRVPIIDDDVVEEEETFTITLRNSNATIESGEATGAIADNDLPTEIETAGRPTR